MATLSNEGPARSRPPDHQADRCGEQGPLPAALPTPAALACKAQDEPSILRGAHREGQQTGRTASRACLLCSLCLSFSICKVGLITAWDSHMPSFSRCPHPQASVDECASFSSLLRTHKKCKLRALNGGWGTTWGCSLQGTFQPTRLATPRGQLRPEGRAGCIVSCTLSAQACPAGVPGGTCGL